MNEIGGQPNRIEKNTKIKGDIVSEADFRIDGKFDGNVKTSGKVVIGKDGYIHGKVECVNADIEGKFQWRTFSIGFIILKSIRGDRRNRFSNQIGRGTRGYV